MTKGRLRVLVADDQPDHLEMVTRILQSAPEASRLDIVSTTNGAAALAAIRAGVDAAFLDIRMPGRSGLDVLADVRADPALRHLPVVIVSSSSDPRDVDRARALGALAYVEKGRYPLFRERVLAALVAVLQGKPL